MIRIVFTFAALLMAFWVSGQQNHDIKGRVVDQDSNPVSYTNIGLEGAFYGTASNADGYFELTVPDELADLNIIFSAVGYKNQVFPVTNLFENDFNTIRLISQSYDIGDIDVNAQSMVLYRILRTASENVSRNFSGGPFALNCRYEHKKQETEGDTLEMMAGVNIYDKTGYATPSIEDAYKMRNYDFINVEKNFKSYLLSDGSTNLDELLGLDLARSLSSLLDPVNQERFVLNQEDDAELNGTDVWVIGFNLAEPGLMGSGDYYASRFEGKIYINKNNYEIRKIEGWVNSGKQNRMGRNLAVTTDSKSVLTDVDYDFSVNYNTEGLEYITLHKNYLQDGKRTTTTTRLIVTDRKTSNLKPITSKEYFVGG